MARVTSDSIVRKLISAIALVLMLGTVGCVGSTLDSGGNPSTAAFRGKPTSTRTPSRGKPTSTRTSPRGSTSLTTSDGGATSPTASTGSPASMTTVAVLAVSGSSLSFGNVPVGTIATQQLTLTNTGNSNLNISAISASGSGFSVSSANVTLTSSQSVGVSVNFLPTATGSMDGALNIASDGVNPLIQIPISGVGVLVPSKDPAGIFDGAGNFDANAYVNAAKMYGTPAMIPERFGNPWTAYHPEIAAPTWSQAASIYHVYPTNPYEWFYYSLGDPCLALDEFSSNYAQVAYVTDQTVAGSQPGVDGIETLEKLRCVWAGQPQLYWPMGGGHDGHPTVSLRPDIVSQLDPYGMPQQPVQVTRAYGGSEWAGCSYMVFETGQVACGEGGNTALDYYYFDPFPTNFVPSAASVTNNGEFLLVTGWNTDSHQGQLAVIAIGSSKPTGTFWGYEWTETYPGFRNYSLPVFDKLLGIIDLPGVTVPTEVEAVGNWVYHPGAGLPANQMPGLFPLSEQANWQCFASQICATLYDTAGFALVSSRYERKVLLIDLTPLFKTISEGMFASWSQFRANVANTGTGPGQWPPTFDELPGETPTIVRTMQFNSPVTAISASLYPDNLALVATEDGILHVWDADGLQTGAGTGTNAREVYTLQVGNNITRIAHMKHWEPPDIVNGAVRYQYIAMSRGDKTVTWIDMSSGAPVVLRALSDSRLVDPISVEDNNNHLTQSDLIDIADYGDRNIKGYRYGPVIFYGVANPPPFFGMGPAGTDPFEYEGAYATPTGPFSISGENVP